MAIARFLSCCCYFYCFLIPYGGVENHNFGSTRLDSYIAVYAENMRHKREKRIGEREGKIKPTLTKGWFGSVGKENLW